MKNLIAVTIISLLSNIQALVCILNIIKNLNINLIVFSLQTLDEELQAAQEICLKETPTFGEPKEYRKFYNCFYEEVGFLKNGSIQYDVMLQKSKSFKYPAFYKNCARRCKDIKGDDRFDVAVKLSLCINKVNTKYFREEWIITSNECKKELKLNSNDIAKLTNYSSIENPSEELKKYTLCVFEKQGLLKDNVLQEDVILEIAKDYEDARYMKTFLDECKEVHNDDKFLKAFKLFECMKSVMGEEFNGLT